MSFGNVATQSYSSLALLSSGQNLYLGHGLASSHQLNSQNSSEFRIAEKTLAFVIGEQVVKRFIDSTKKVAECTYSIFQSIDRYLSFPSASAEPLPKKNIFEESPEFNGRVLDIFNEIILPIPLQPADPMPIMYFPPVPRIDPILVDLTEENIQALSACEQQLGQISYRLNNVEDQMLQIHNEANQRFGEELDGVNQKTDAISKMIASKIGEISTFLSKANDLRLKSLNDLSSFVEEDLMHLRETKGEAREIYNKLTSMSKQDFADKGSIFLSLYAQKMNNELGKTLSLDILEKSQKLITLLTSDTISGAKKFITMLSNEITTLINNFQTKVNAISTFTKEQRAGLIETYKSIMDREKVLFAGYLELRKQIMTEQDTKFKQKLQDRKEAIEQYTAIVKTNLEAEVALRTQNREDKKLQKELNDSSSLLDNLLEPIVGTVVGGPAGGAVAVAKQIFQF